MEKIIITTASLHGRTGPGLTFPIVMELRRGQIFEVVGGPEKILGYVWRALRTPIFDGAIVWAAAADPLGNEFMADYVPEDIFRFEAWPTEFMVITQGFGANPQNYEQFGLPGHEGLDIRAPHGSKIFTVAAGTVIRTGDEREPRAKGGHNYGVRAYIEHRDDFETVYGHLDTRLVDVGEEVVAGQQIGTADNTGNSFGSHLHLVLKNAALNKKAKIKWPYRIIDPTPYAEEYLRG